MRSQPGPSVTSATEQINIKTKHSQIHASIMGNRINTLNELYDKLTRLRPTHGLSNPRNAAYHIPWRCNTAQNNSSIHHICNIIAMRMSCVNDQRVTCVTTGYPKFSPYGSVCCACTQRSGLPRACHSGKLARFALHCDCKQCSALTMPSLHARGCASPCRAR